MVPSPNLSPQNVAEWLSDLAKHPVDPDELRQSEAYDPNDPHLNPEVAASLDQDDLPMWWPKRDPDSRALLSSQKRREWCLKFLAGQWSPMRRELESASEKSRRQLLAQSLLHIHSELSTGEVPTPASL